MEIYTIRGFQDDVYRKSLRDAKMMLSRSTWRKRRTNIPRMTMWTKRPLSGSSLYDKLLY